MYNWSWDWGWGWLATAGSIVLLGLFLIPWFFFLLNLNNLLEHVREENRAMAPSHVWLNFIPLFCLGWFIYTVIKVRDSVRTEYEARRWQPEGDFGYNVGIAAGVLWIASVFVGWTPFIGWLIAIGWLVCWILYWLKTSDLKKRLDERAAWRSGNQTSPYRQAPPYPQAPPYSSPGTPYSGQGAGAGQPPYAGRSPHGGGAPYGWQTPPPAQKPAPGTYAGAEAGNRSAEDRTTTPGEPGEGFAGEPAEEPGARSRVCMACGSSYDPGDKFCRSCGLPLPRE